MEVGRQEKKVLPQFSALSVVRYWGRLIGSTWRAAATPFTMTERDSRWQHRRFEKQNITIIKSFFIDFCVYLCHNFCSVER